MEQQLGRYLVIGGLVLLIVGVCVYLAGRAGLPLGRLPGDIRLERDGGGFYFPITTSILISVVLTIALNVLLRIFRK